MITVLYFVHYVVLTLTVAKLLNHATPASAVVYVLLPSSGLP